LTFFARKPSITPEQAAAVARRELVLVDVRDPAELRGARVHGAANIPLGQLRARIAEREHGRQAGSCAAHPERSAPRWSILVATTPASMLLLAAPLMAPMRRRTRRLPDPRLRALAREAMRHRGA
jgi:hypothetical protein